MSQGSGSCCCSTTMGEHDGHFGSWAFHKGGNGGFTQVLARAAAGVRRRDPCSTPPSTHVITKDGQAVGVALEDGTEFTRQRRRQRARPAAHVHAAGRSARAAERAQRQHRPLPVPGHVGQGQLRPRRCAEVPGARRPHRPVPRLHQHRPVDRVPRARLRRREVRLVQQAPVHRRRDPVVRRPRHGASRQARDVVLRPVRAVPPEGQRLGHRAAELRRHRAGRRSSRSSPASATSCCTARWSRRSTSSGSSGSPRATSSPASSSRRRCTSSARPRAGASTAPRSTATTSAAPAPTRAAASPVGREAGRAADHRRPGPPGLRRTADWVRQRRTLVMAVGRRRGTVRRVERGFT